MDDVTVEEDLLVDGNVAIGLSDPHAPLHVVGDTVMAGSDMNLWGTDAINVVSYADGDQAYQHTFIGGAYSMLLRNLNSGYLIGVDRSNGSYASPTALTDGDSILSIRTGGRTSSGIHDFETAMSVSVDGTPTSDSVPVKYTFANGRIQIPAYGNVGIYPAQSVEIVGALKLHRTASDYNVLSLSNDNGVAVHLNANGNSVGDLRTATNHPLTLSTNNVEQVRITTSGNVGVGTNSPTAKLEVAGDVKIDGTVTAQASGDIPMFQ